MTHAAYVTTIIASHKTSVGEEDVKTFSAQLHDLGSEVSDTHCLCEGVAYDLFHERLPRSDTLTAWHAKIQDTHDIITQPTTHRQKKLLISDMDSTMIEQECIDEMADYLGLKDKISTITERAMNGELDFKEALRERVKLLEGLPCSALDEVYDERITLMAGAKTLLRTMKANDAYCVLVSGGFRFFTSKVTEALGFDEHHSNTLGVIDAKLNGEVIEPILDKDTKEHLLTSISPDQNVNLEETLAVGDGANDLPMLLAAGLGVAYRAKPIVRAQAQAQIIHNDLSALLYVQGYPKADWMM